MTALALLILALAVVVYFIRDDRHELARFKALQDTVDRQRRYRLWIAKGFLLFMVSSIGALAVLGRLGALAGFPSEFSALPAMLPPFEDDDLSKMTALIAGGVIGGGVLGALLARRKQGAKPVMLGDVAAILPQNRAELLHGALLSLNAGVTEELFFRLLLPLLIVLVTGNALLAFIAATLIFGLVHLYQGWVGVLATTVLGALLAAVYLATGSLLIAIAVHVLIDLNALVLRPALAGAWRR